MALMRYPFLSNQSQFTPTLTPPPIPVKSTEVTTIPSEATNSSQVSSKPSSNSDMLRDNFGIAAGGGLSFLSRKDIMTRLQAMKDAGAKWVRFDIDWSLIQEDGPNSYDWKGYDGVVSVAQELGLEPIALLTYTPSWARISNCSSSKCAPADPAQFAKFASLAADRYSKKGVKVWEIWNEENYYGYWMPAVDISSYISLLKSSYLAIKNIDPTATVLTGGLAAVMTGQGNIGEVDFVKLLYTGGAKGFFDGVSVHPYSYPFLPTYNTVGNPWPGMLQMHQVMSNYGDEQKKIWITEFGAPTNGPGSVATLGNAKKEGAYDHVSEELQAQILKDALKSYQNYTWIGPFLWYSYQDTGTDKSNKENFFGLVRYDGSKKPSYDTLEELLTGQ